MWRIEVSNSPARGLRGKSVHFQKHVNCGRANVAHGVLKGAEQEVSKTRIELCPKRLYNVRKQPKTTGPLAPVDSCTRRANEERKHGLEPDLSQKKKDGEFETWKGLREKI